MVLKFHMPFSTMAQPEAVITLKEVVSLRELIGLLAAKYPALGRYAEFQTDEALGAHVAFVANARALKLVDSVADTDQVDVMLPMVGG
jgi:hypothetical protein